VDQAIELLKEMETIGLKPSVVRAKEMMKKTCKSI